ncbi:phage holin family protein [Companilactobacillus sp. HBUAS59699]|uniref:phage holin family protein n=1 Tax=Companilactobacillus sp. HBUAS59699 TaxID=3109358 RepID=UPI002FF1536D
MYDAPIPKLGLTEWWIAANQLSENPWFTTFLMIIIVDLTTGFLKGFFKHSKQKVNSTVGREGLIRHFTIVGIATIFYPLVASWGLSEYANMFLAFFIGQYGISIVENLGEMGIPIPKWLVKRLSKLTDDDTEEKTK